MTDMNGSQTLIINAISGFKIKPPVLKLYDVLDQLVNVSESFTITLQANREEFQ